MDRPVRHRGTTGPYNRWLHHIGKMLAARPLILQGNPLGVFISLNGHDKQAQPAIPPVVSLYSEEDIGFSVTEALPQDDDSSWG